jgi:hypothetical protein
MECFTWVNTILGNLKTSMSGTFHAFDFEKYASRYLAAVQYRFNRPSCIAAEICKGRSRGRETPTALDSPC